MSGQRWFVVTVTAEIVWPAGAFGSAADTLVTDLMSRDDIVTARVGRPTVFRLDVSSTARHLAEQWARDVGIEVTTRLGLLSDTITAQAVAEAARSVGPISEAN